MMFENVTKDAGGIYARLLDHRPIVQGELKYFVKEFEGKRNDREYDRIRKLFNEVTEANEKFIPDSIALMDKHLPDIKDKLSIANRMCSRMCVREEQRMAKDPLKTKRDTRQEEWSEFIKKQGEKSAAVDKEHEKRMKEIEEEYKEMGQALIKASQPSQH
ncbi:biogenesis of lysosome-related organelles complex 1 subunit 5-like [Saccoglossus kowalevskii]|uniref:Biogenesis of lysosome-related organelles complex 1 subunit 5 n=1 Tax=Saccoglossus kowalevskii TaxID=10224 RepID=A0ABM0H1A8_SACKO|nr:PREDICTED: biogenesis of lysosome-related organelles complex 1 subunit 5-like [Saccoglossus kowalevskii]